MDSDGLVFCDSEVKKLEYRVRELERIARPIDGGGRNPLRSPFKSRARKADIAADLVSEGRFQVKTAAETLDVSRSNRVERLKSRSTPRGSYTRPKMQSFCPPSEG